MKEASTLDNLDIVGDAKKIWLQMRAENFKLNNNALTLTNDADGFLMLEDAKGKSFRLNDDLIVKVDTNVEFDGFTNCYVSIGTKVTLTVGEGAGNVEV